MKLLAKKFTYKDWCVKRSHLRCGSCLCTLSASSLYVNFVSKWLCPYLFDFWKKSPYKFLLPDHSWHMLMSGADSCTFLPVMLNNTVYTVCFLPTAEDVLRKGAVPRSSAVSDDVTVVMA